MKYWTIDSLLEEGACWEEERLKRWYNKYGVSKISTLGVLELKGITNRDKLWVFWKDHTLPKYFYTKYFHIVVDRIVKNFFLGSSIFVANHFAQVWLSGKNRNIEYVKDILLVMPSHTGYIEKKWLNIIIEGFEVLESFDYMELEKYFDDVYYYGYYYGAFCPKKEYSRQLKDLLGVFKSCPSMWSKKRYK